MYLFEVTSSQEKCAFFVEKLHRMRATRDMERCLSDLTAYGLARASARCYGEKTLHLGKILLLCTLRHLD